MLSLTNQHECLGRDDVLLKKPRIKPIFRPGSYTVADSAAIARFSGMYRLQACKHTLEYRSRGAGHGLATRAFVHSLAVTICCHTNSFFDNSGITMATWQKQAKFNTTNTIRLF